VDLDSADIDWGYVLERLESLLDLGEEALTRNLAEFQFDPELFAGLLAFRWQREQQGGYLRPISHPDLPDCRELIGLDDLLQRLRRNTRQFLQRAGANHVLLTGEQGSGKSSAIRGLLSEFGDTGLRLIEVHSRYLHQLPEIITLLGPQPYFFILFCDDFSPAVAVEHPELMSLLDGTLEAIPENMLIYATCTTENLSATQAAGSCPVGNQPLFDRFGLMLECPAVTRETYLAIVRRLVIRRELSIAPEALDQEALQWAGLRGSHSGRVARQFVNDLCGRLLSGKS